jgi:signal transduction histidine kinase
LRWAGWAFVLYAFTQAVVPPVDAFPANVLNTATFHSLTGIPIQLVRAFCAVVITISLLRAIQATEAERQQQMLAAQKARLDALEQVQQEMIKRQALRQELLRQTVIAQEEERARVARELHDETAQILTAFSLHLAALRDAVPEDSKADQEIDRLQGLSRKMSQGIYNLVRNLRPAQLDDLGLMAALQYLVGEARERMGLEVQLDVEGERYRLDSLAETVFFRVAQEALTNVARHAGTGEAHLQLAFSPQQVTLRVSDKGVGFIIPEETSMPPGWGLVGMRERVESVGGKLNLRSAPGKGTVVEVTIPVKSSNIGDFS